MEAEVSDYHEDSNDQTTKVWSHIVEQQHDKYFGVR